MKRSQRQVRVRIEPHTGSDVVAPFFSEHSSAVVASIAAAVGGLFVRFLTPTGRALYAAKRELEALVAAKKAELEQTQEKHLDDITRMLDYRTKENLDLLTRINKTEAEIIVIKRLYEDSLAALHRANDENDDLKRRLKSAADLREKLAEYERKIEEYELEISSLRNRLSVLEGRKDGHD